METIEIALAANESYVCGLFVTACSIAERCDRGCALRFNVLDSEIPAESKAMVEAKVAELHPHASFRWIPVNEQMFVGLQKWNGGYMVYTRLLLPKLLSDCDWVIYCDCDFLWLRDVAELWRERDERYGVISTVDGSSDILNGDAPWFRKNGFPFDLKTYFCAGLTFFNLKMFRENGWQERCLDLLQLHPPYNDQSVLNVVTDGVKKLLPKSSWQCFALELTKEAVERGVVIHHAGAIPWKRTSWILNPLTDATMLWHRANAKFRGISVWRSLRTWFPVWYILWHRGIYWVAQVPGVKWGLKTLCAMMGHHGVWRLFEANTRRLGV